MRVGHTVDPAAPEVVRQTGCHSTPARGATVSSCAKSGVEDGDGDGDGGAVGLAPPTP
jgi:hypothetical protein